MSARETRTRARIIDAATRLGLRVGPDLATMEAIAREAGIAKPTLYRYFPDKDAVFTAASEALLDEMRKAAAQGLEGPGAPAERIARAINAKHRVASALLANSPHAEALYSEHNRLAGPQTTALHLWLERQIADILHAAGAQDPSSLAALLVAACDGIAAAQFAPETVENYVSTLTGRIIAPALP